MRGSAKLRTGGDRYLEKAFGLLTSTADKRWKKKVVDRFAGAERYLSRSSSEVCSGRKLKRWQRSALETLVTASQCSELRLVPDVARD